MVSKNSSAIKTAHLGMPYGTAMHKLRKMIVFRMAQRLAEDFCFKCGQRIETVEELSIDHKIAWLHGETSLFWDLDNIAFSHRICNLPDKFADSKPRFATFLINLLTASRVKRLRERRGAAAVRRFSAAQNLRTIGPPGMACKKTAVAVFGR